MNTKLLISAALSAVMLAACGGGSDDSRPTTPTHPDTPTNPGTPPVRQDCAPSLIGARLAAAEAFEAIKGKTFRPHAPNACGETDSVVFSASGAALYMEADGRPDDKALTAQQVQNALGDGHRELDGDVVTYAVYRAEINGVVTLQIVEAENGKYDGVYINP